LLKNPVVLASGTFDQSITKKNDIDKLGGIITKTITLLPKVGNPLPHIYKTKHGWFNSVGLKNPGLKNYLTLELPFWSKFKTEVITSIGGETQEEYVELAQKLSGKTKSLEVNISCPNVKNGGLSFGTDPAVIEKLITSVKKVFAGTLIVKLTPNVTDITQIAQAAMDAGADALTVANTVLGLEINHEPHKKVFARVVAGYSGSAIKPINLKNVWQIWEKLHCPILASGGVESTEDALDFIYAGASAIQIGSANFLNPQISVRIAEDLKNYFIDHNIKSIDQIKGKLDVT
jgi:dihydroorotate dehydrogenase (NAD+) catalytic subunit